MARSRRVYVASELHEDEPEVKEQSERGGRECAPGDRDRDRSQRSTRQSLVCGE